MHIKYWYLPSSLSTQSVSHNTVQIQKNLEARAWRPVHVEWDNKRQMYAVTMNLYWSTDSHAISFADYRATHNRPAGGVLHLSDRNDASNDNKNPVVDVLPDQRAVEGSVSRSPVDVAGIKDYQYKNNTEIDTTSSVIVDVTDYNHSIADWMQVSGMKQTSGANATIGVMYAYANGTLTNTWTNFLSTDFWYQRQNWFGQMTMPSATADSLGNKATYVAKFNFTDISLEHFKTYSFESKYSDARTNIDTFSYDTPAQSGLKPSGLWSTISSTVSNNLAKIPVPTSTQDISQASVGFSDLKDKALAGISSATGISTDSIKDHQVIGATDKFVVPDGLTQNILSGMKSVYKAGSEGAQDLFRSGNEFLKSSSINIDLPATKFGDAADVSRDLTGNIFKGIASTSPLGSLFMSGKNGTSLFDKAKNALGQLPHKAAGMFNKFNPGAWISKAGKYLKWIVVAIIIILVLIVALKIFM